ncbi:MAG: hypothetical protein K2W95_07280 [Candidatus Obscuribacterales bacterium]|nr:hypothetical protein [Candidatus Obscuribacterales bacterium]
MKVIPSLLLAALLSLAALDAAWSADGIDADTKKTLAKLEQKYFGHSFETDVDDARASRLEQMIFGEENTGKAQERIAKILAVSPLEASVPAPPSVDENATEARPAKSKGKSNRAPKQPPPDLQTSADGPVSQNGGTGDSFSQSEYPHVSALEQVILGKTDEGSSLAERFGKLETKAFGKPSTGDFSQRTDALDAYSEKTLHIKIVREEAPDEETTYVAPPGATIDNSTTPGGKSAPDSDGETSDYPKITALETAILGETHAGQPVSERLARMEACAFGEASKVTDLSQRSDALEAYTRKTLHKKPLLPEQHDNETAFADGGNTAGGSGRAQSQGSRPGMSKKQIFAIAANTLLGATGFGGAAMGLTAAGMGMEAMREQQEAKQRGSQSNQTQESGEPEDEDPIAFAKVPPPANARLISKVAWCEAHVFGQTFASMHLKQRLRQLSQELQFNVQKTDLQLMDDVDGMIKAVLTQVMHMSPIGTAQKTAPKGAPAGEAPSQAALGTAPPTAPAKAVAAKSAETKPAAQ